MRQIVSAQATVHQKALHVDSASEGLKPLTAAHVLRHGWSHALIRRWTPVAR